jgi:hypothetical protein
MEHQDRHVSRLALIAGSEKEGAERLAIRSGYQELFIVVEAKLARPEYLLTGTGRDVPRIDQLTATRSSAMMLFDRPPVKLKAR